MSEQFGVFDQRHTNWFWVDNAVVKNLCKDIGPTGFTVYCVLAMYSNKSRKSWPSYTTISEQIGISRRSVITAMQKLIECGLITRIESSTKGNMYQLNDANQLVQNLHQTLPASEKSDTTSEKNDTQLVKKTTRITDTNKTHRTILNNKRDNFEDSESSKRIDHRGKPSPTAERMRKARQKGLKPWEALRTQDAQDESELPTQENVPVSALKAGTNDARGVRRGNRTKPTRAVKQKQLLGVV